MIVVIIEARFHKSDEHFGVIAPSEPVMQKIPHVTRLEMLIDQTHEITYGGPESPDIAVGTKPCSWVGRVECGWSFGPPLFCSLPSLY